jgi:hypothetical protein
MATDLKKTGVSATPTVAAGGGLIPNFAPQAPEKAKELESLSSSGNWLPRLALFGGNSDAAKEGKVPIGHYGLVTAKDQLVVLGPAVDVLVISWRPTAIDTRSEDTVVSSHDKNSELFKSIQDQADNVKDSGCMYGPEFLVYIPAVKKFATFLLGSKSFRREALPLSELMTKAATIRSKLVKTERFSWHVPVVTACTTPFDTIPPLEEIAEKAELFNNPPVVKTPEKIEPEVAATGKRAR